MHHELISLLNGRRGHFQLESGFHGEEWFDLDQLFRDLDRLRPFTAELARRLAKHDLDLIGGPMTGGAELARLVGDELGLPSFFSERFAPIVTEGLFPVRYEIPAARRQELQGRVVAIVDDAVSAGSAVRGTYDDLLACGARPVVVGALFTFGDDAREFAAARGLQLEALVKMPLGVWRPEECPLCRSGMPLEKL
jgi:orotate phosphoribosyltransferase